MPKVKEALALYRSKKNDSIPSLFSIFISNINHDELNSRRMKPVSMNPHTIKSESGGKKTSADDVLSLQDIEAFAKKTLDGARTSHDWEHTLRVLKLCERIGTKEGVDMDVELHEYNEEWAQHQSEKLKELRKNRDNKAVKESLKALEMATRRKENVMPYLVECCKSYATVGEMSNVFREVFGELVEPSIF